MNIHVSLNLLLERLEHASIIICLLWINICDDNSTILYKYTDTLIH